VRTPVLEAERLRRPTGRQGGIEPRKRHKPTEYSTILIGGQAGMPLARLAARNHRFYDRKRRVGHCDEETMRPPTWGDYYIARQGDNPPNCLYRACRWATPARRGTPSSRDESGHKGVAHQRWSGGEALHGGAQGNRVSSPNPSANPVGGQEALPSIGATIVVDRGPGSGVC
jgi:hypothetical protein